MLSETHWTSTVAWTIKHLSSGTKTGNRATGLAAEAPIEKLKSSAKDGRARTPPTKPRSGHFAKRLVMPSGSKTPVDNRRTFQLCRLGRICRMKTLCLAVDMERAVIILYNNNPLNCISQP